MPCPSDEYTGGDLLNHHWRNYIGSVDIRVERYWTPRSLGELVRILKEADGNNRRVHPVGAGYSFEDIAASNEWMIDLSELKSVLPALFAASAPALTPDWRAAQFGELPTFSTKLLHVEAGIRLFDLCRALDERNMALPTMGGALGQHLAGAISTSTHGSDVFQPPLCDLVQAVHLVTTAGQEWWIESSSRPLRRLAKIT